MRPPDQSKAWMKFAAMGMELSGITLGLAGIGFLADWYWSLATPYGTAAGAAVGFAFAMFRFIQQANRSEP